MDGQRDEVTGRRPRHVRARDPWWRFLAATALASLGLALAYGALSPQGFAADEPAHTAYAAELRHGHLPDVDTLQPTSPYAAEHADARNDDRVISDGSTSSGEPGGNDSSTGAGGSSGQSSAHEATVASGQPRPEDYIYVANHPPAFAAVQAGVTATLARTGLAADATLAVGRVLNALCTVAAVAFLALLGREVAGNLRTGVLAAALFAALPALWSLASFGYSDGAGTLATTLVVWAAVVAWNAGTTRSMGLLGFAVAGAGATRAMALVVAVAVAVVVLGRQLVRHRSRESNPWRWRARVRRDVTLVVLPPLLLSAWWYIRTWIRSGDPTASAVLNGRLQRQPRPGGILAQLVDVDLWQRMITQLTASSYIPNPIEEQVRLASWPVWATGLVSLVALVGLLRRPSEDVDHRRGSRHQGPSTDRASSESGPARTARAELRGWPVLIVAVFGVMFAVAGHVSNGGAPHGRYLLLVMPVLCLLATIGLERLGPRLPLLAVAAATVASLRMLHASTAWVDDLRGELGLDRFAASWLSMAGTVMAVTGIALAAAAARAARAAT